MSVRMRHTSGHTRNRRSHHALEEPRLSNCANCGEKHLRHKVCMSCGQYRGRKVVDVEAIKQRKVERKKAKLKELGKEPELAEGKDKKTKGTKSSDEDRTSKNRASKEAKTQEGPLSVEELSKK